MTDYILSAGRGTTVREDTEALTAHVDMNVVNLDDISGSPSSTDMVAIQKAGATMPVKTSLLSLKSVLGGGSTGRVRNFIKLSESDTLIPAVGTDLLVFFERENTTTQTLTFPATNMAGRAGDIIRVILCGQCKLTFSTGSGNLLIKPAYYGATANYLLTTQSTTGDWTFICDGTYWRVYMLPQLFE